MTKKQFDRLKPATRRMKIAQDVLDTLKLKERKRFRVVKGTYCSINTGKANFFKGKKRTQVQSLLPEIGKNCEACGMGALFLSHIRLFDRVTVGELGVIDCDDMNKSVLQADGDDIVSALSGSFSGTELRIIEAAFEGNTGNFTYQMRQNVNHGDYVSLSDQWLTRKTDDTKRLRAICRNIIAHNGDFDITDLP